MWKGEERCKREKVGNGQKKSELERGETIVCISRG